MKQFAWLLAVVLSFGMAPEAWAGAKEEVAAAAEQWAKHFSADTAQGLLALYDKEAVLWGTRSATIAADPAAIHEYSQKSFERLPKRKVTFGQQVIRVYGDTAINTGSYTLSR